MTDQPEAPDRPGAPDLSGSRAERNRRHVLDLARTLLAVGGPERITVRRLAADAGLVVGSLRYVFPTQAELVTALADDLHARRADRLRGLRGDVVTQATATLHALAPLDEDRRTECRAIATLLAGTAIPDGSSAAVERLRTQLAETAAAVVTALTLGRRLAVEDRRAETDRLVALVVGLAWTGLSGEAAAAAIARQVTDLRPAEPPAPGPVRPERTFRPA